MSESLPALPWWLVHRYRAIHLIQLLVWTYLGTGFVRDASSGEGAWLWIVGGPTLLLAVLSAAASIHLTRYPAARRSLLDLFPREDPARTRTMRE